MLTGREVLRNIKVRELEDDVRWIIQDIENLEELVKDIEYLEKDLNDLKEILDLNR